jgi:Ca2+-binding RTX toxin-like protein
MRPLAGRYPSNGGMTMAYSATGTAGNDTLNQAGDTGPGTIVGLAGDDSILQGTGSAQVFGNSGNDTVVLQTGNTGTVNGGTENDSVFSTDAIGSMQLFGGDGADTINVQLATAAQTVVGGNDSSDGADSIRTGSGADLIFGNGGADSLRSNSGADTYIGGFGNDDILEELVANGDQLVFGNEGNDSVFVSAGNDTVFAGLGNDSIRHDSVPVGGNPLLFGNEGADTIDAGSAIDATIVGGNDSADGADSIDVQAGGTGTLFAFGNGGADTIDFDVGSATLIGGQGNDSFEGEVASQGLFFGNEGNDTMNIGTPGPQALTVFGGLGNDSLFADDGPDTIQGNEGNDTLRGDENIDTISGGSGNDVFRYANDDDDGDNAAGGGPVEFLTDVNFNEDRFQVLTPMIEFAANIGAGTGANLNAAANNAIAAANALGGGGATTDVAALFTFGGRTYLAINQDATRNAFDDAGDLLLDITGATGTIDTGDFIT